MELCISFPKTAWTYTYPKIKCFIKKKNLIVVLGTLSPCPFILWVQKLNPNNTKAEGTHFLAEQCG